MTSATFSIWRGTAGEGRFEKYTTEISEGRVVLDAVHKIQAEQANDLSVRWNCKAGKCGSCSAEINGMPRLMCMTRMNELPSDKPVFVEPMKCFPHIRDLVTDVSWNFEVKKTIISNRVQAQGSSRYGNSRTLERAERYRLLNEPTQAES